MIWPRLDAGNAVASRLRKISPAARHGEQALGRLSGHLTFSAANSRRLNLFERSVKSGVEFCFFLVGVRHRTDSLRQARLGGTDEVFARRSVYLIAPCLFSISVVFSIGRACTVCPCPVV